MVVPDAEVLTRLSGTSWLQMPPMVWGIEYVLREALQRETDRLHHTDQVTALAQALAQTAALDIVQGSWTFAKANALQGLEVAEEIGDDHLASQCRSSLGWLAAARGEERTVADFAARTIEMSVPREVRVLSASGQWSLGMLALFAGRAEEALDRLVRLTEHGHHTAHPTIALVAAADTAEAALQAGAGDGRGSGAVAAAVCSADRRGVGNLHDAPGPCPAGVGGGCGETVPACAGCSGSPFAALQLCPDAPVVRRVAAAGRRTDARAQLAEAAETFRRLNAALLLARTRAEQELTGQQPRRDSPVRDTAVVLTPQEVRVARLAAEGLTNREIGAQLLISPRAVGHHLANVFPKLGIDLARRPRARRLRGRAAPGGLTGDGVVGVSGWLADARIRPVAPAYCVVHPLDHQDGAESAAWPARNETLSILPTAFFGMASTRKNAVGRL
ncbi:helix-turn-helix transcriptional regulator [Streptomyces sp. GTA36]